MGFTEYLSKAYSDPYISLLIIIVISKLIFIIASIILLVLSKVNPSNQHIEKLTVIQDKTHNLFTLLLSILLIYLFNPYKNREAKVDKETKILLYLYGWITILYLVKQFIANR
jgi:surface polysaccharide O-acyltransferase-like enzyme